MSATRKVFYHSMKRLMAVFGDLSTEALQIYWQVLGPRMSDRAMSLAVDRACTECKFMPKPAELIEFGSGSAELDHRAELAWITFSLAFHRYGSSRALCFEDTAIHAAVRSMGGLLRMGQMSTMDFARVGKKRFIEAYKAAFWLPTGAKEKKALVGRFGSSEAVQVPTSQETAPTVQRELLLSGE